jgi:protein-L-isoaspartate O-methyltransferase
MTRRLARGFVPHGASPLVWRRLIQAIDRRLAYDAATQTVTVRSGPLIGMTKCGLFADGDAAFAAGTYEPEVVAALTDHCCPGATAFDIGANVGYHTMLLSRLVGVGGRVDAFEPVPATADSLEQTLKFNDLGNVTVHRLAVGTRHCHDALCQRLGVRPSPSR